MWWESWKNKQEQQQPLICILVEGISPGGCVSCLQPKKACLGTHLSFLPGITKLASFSVISLTKWAKKEKKKRKKKNVQNNPNSKAVLQRGSQAASWIRRCIRSPAGALHSAVAVCLGLWEHQSHTVCCWGNFHGTYSFAELKGAEDMKWAWRYKVKWRWSNTLLSTVCVW